MVPVRVPIGLGIALFAIATAGGVYLGMEIGGASKSATPATANAEPTEAPKQRVTEAAEGGKPAGAAQEPTLALSFNAIGPNVNKEAGDVCEGERWTLIGADSDVNGNHLVWQGENGEYREFAYRWNGKVIRLTDVKSGAQVMFPMVHQDSGDWLVKGKRLEECAG